MNFYCLGAANIDIKAVPQFPIVIGETIPVNTISCYGGVARNVAENLSVLGAKTHLLSSVGNDSEGHQLIAALENIGVDTKDILVSDELPTGKYYALLGEERELFIATADMEIYKKLTPTYVIPRISKQTEIRNWILDADLPSETIEAVALFATKKQKLWGVAVSAVKTPRLASGFPHWHALFLNRSELQALTEEKETYAGIRQVIKRGCRHLFVTHGPHEVLYAHDDQIIHYPCPKADVIDVIGAGDAFSAGIIYSLSQDRSLNESLEFGFGMAKNALASYSSSLNKDKT